MGWGHGGVEGASVQQPGARWMTRTVYVHTIGTYRTMRRSQECLSMRKMVQIAGGDEPPRFLTVTIYHLGNGVQYDILLVFDSHRYESNHLGESH